MIRVWVMGLLSAAVAFSAPVPDNPLNTLATPKNYVFDPAARRAELLARISVRFAGPRIVNGNIAIV